MATTINSGYANSPKLTANIADHADVYGGKALVFDGVTDYLDCGDIDTSGNFSFSCWFNADSVTGHHMIFSMSDQSTSDGMSCGFYSGKGGKIYATANHGSTSSTKITSVLSTGQWYHLVVTKSSGQTENIYINGASDTNSADSNWGLANESVIGSRNAGSNFLFNGKISDVKLFNSILTEEQVTELYRKPENTPSAVQNNLVAWYPMCEGNPESPQSIVYDHSEKKLGSELLSDSSFELSGEQSAGANGTYYNLDSEVSISNGQLISNATSSTTTNVVGGISVVQGKTYKIEVVVASGSLDANLRFQNSNNSVNTGFVQFSEGLNTFYYSPSATASLARIVGSASDKVWTIESISIKEVLMGNHATTNFFGNMSDLLSSAQKTALGTMLDSDDNSFIFTNGNTPTGTNKFSAIDGTIEITSNTLKLTNDGTTKAHVALPFTTEVGKSYVAEIKLVTANMQGGLSVSDDLEENTLTAGLSSGVIITSNTFVAIGTTSYVHIKNNQGNNNQYNLYDNLKVREVGVSSSGFETALNEPVVPQVPLMRYNQKAIFDRNKNTYVSLTEQTLGANTAFTIAFLFTPFNNNEHHMIGKNSTDDTIRVDTSGAHRIAIRINNDFGSMTGTGNVNANESHFCVITRTTGGAFSVYRNGVKSTASFTNTSDFKYQYLGQSLNGGWESDGLLDEFSIFNTHFSDAEAQELFNDGVALDAMTHSKKGNLLGYWRNDGVTTWQDRRGWSAIDFDATGDYINVSTTLHQSNTGTISGWFNMDSTSGNQTFFSVGRDFEDTLSGTGNVRALFKDTSHNLKFIGYSADWDTTVDLVANTWYHLAVTWNNNDIVVYVNGVGYSNSSLSLNTPTGTRLKIGTATWTDNFYLNGKSSSVSQYSTVKSASEILALFNAGINSSEASNSNLIGYWKLNTASTDANAIKDLSSNSNHGTVNGNPTLNDGNDGTVQGSPDSITIREGLNSNRDGLGFYFTNPSSNVLRLNGVDEFIAVPPTDMGLKEQMTIECWAKHNTGDSSGEQIVDQYDYANNQRSFRLLIDSSEKIQLDTNDNGNSNFNRYLSNSAISNIDNWRHYAITFSSGTVVMYVDGQVQANTQTTSGGGTSIFNNTTDDIKIGSAWTGSGVGANVWNGLLDEFRIYNRALSADEINKNYKHQKGKHKND